MPADTGNLVIDCITNTAIVLEDNASRLRLKRIYKDDVINVEATPAVAISNVGTTFERRTLGRNARFEVDFINEIWYYHEELNPDTRKNDVMKAAYDVGRTLIENASLNGWLRSTESYIRACTWVVRRTSSILYATARIIHVARYQTRYTVS
jgi:hypothetical protein